MSFFAPFSFFRTAWIHRFLIVRLAARGLESSYRGSVLGFLWLILQPFLLLALFTFVFSVILPSSWEVPGLGRTGFAVVFFPGWILYTLFAECLQEAPALLESHRGHLKQALFPSEVLAWVLLLGALFRLLVSGLLLLVLYLFLVGWPPLAALFLPLLVVPVACAALGAIWFLSSLAVFVRDLSQLVSLTLTALLFLSPVFYPVAAVPERLRPLYELNPFAVLLEMARAALFAGSHPDWPRWGLVAVLGWLLAVLGYGWFMSTKKALADVL